ncbi:MAG: M23 family metallopeptidase, partial [Actinomycetota bacterium]|nr:M23 family metallopeptidase [Actinomycetota bacterium]
MSLFPKLPKATLASLASVAIALTTATAAVAAIDTRAPVRDSLVQSVSEAMTAHRGSAAQAYFEYDHAQQPRVEPKRADSAGQWAFGTTVIPIPADAKHKHGSPENAIFLARATGSGWRVTFDGTREFRALVGQAPTSVVSAEEKTLFSKVPDTTLVNTGLALPWSQNAAWGWGGGPHGYSGSNRPFSSIDFGGYNQSVLSPASGRIYKSCISGGSALVTVVHDSGYRTSYYHMTNLTTLADGTAIQLGTRLGTTGTALPCGGSANGAHVHFTLLSGSGSYVAVHGKTIGGWTFYEG